MVEFLSAFEADEKYFGRLRLAQTVVIQIGLERDAYLAFRRIVDQRPFESLPGVRHRYFFTGRYGGKTDDSINLGIRVELGDRALGSYEPVPHSLAGNMLWLFKVKDNREVVHLVAEPSPDRP